MKKSRSKKAHKPSDEMVLVAIDEQVLISDESPDAPNERQLSADELGIELLRKSEIFDANWYLERYPDLQGCEIDAAAHYYFQGGLEGRDPCYLFDSKWYLERYVDVTDAAMNPLVHYILHGEREGRSPSPYFEPGFYRSQLAEEKIDGSLLAHYLHRGWQTYWPNEFFNTGFYLSQNADVADAGIPPLKHYVLQGWREGREIHPTFSFNRYQKVLEERMARQVEPLRHYLLVGRVCRELLPSYNDPQAARLDLLKGELLKNQQPGSNFEPDLIGGEKTASAADARVFAFYLPQFYPFEENNNWWGKGFTEWRNVTRALPRFEGHQQPRLPADFGFYDLRNAETIKEQVAAAKRSGVSGFCFYYYWFNGSRLLDKPLDLFTTTCPEFPFSLMWANENWTRRWDGLENDVLMQQDYRDADDEALVADLAHYFNLPSYERVDGRPLFIIYRPGIIPGFKNRLSRWRTLFKEEHNLQPLILMALAFDDYDPTTYGLDGGIEFPPHKIAQGLSAINAELNIIDTEFTGHYMSYDSLVESSLSVPAPKFEMIRTAVPSWDNDARKPGRGMGFVGSTPQKYEEWLRKLIQQAVERPFYGEKPYVFVNAWNEWAEGAHLEPDLHHGVAYLNATFRAVTGQRKTVDPAKNILLVGHDAYLHGAQLLTLNIMKTLSRQFGLNVTLLLGEGGPLVEEYRKHGEVIVVSESHLSLVQLIQQLEPNFPDRQAICNTVVTGKFVEELSNRGFRVVALIHELSQLILERSLEGNAKAIANQASNVVFASQFVQASFERITGPIGPRAVLRPQGIYQQVKYDPSLQANLKDDLRLPAEARIVINLGYGDLRKGFDLFVGVAKQVIAREPNAHFVWLGNLHGDLKHWYEVDLNCAPLSKNFHVLPFSGDVNKYLNGSDVFALTSREDPFPSVVLEALACGLPVVAFNGGGGYIEAIEEHKMNGVVVPMADIGAMANAILSYLTKSTAIRAATTRSERALARYNWREYVFGLLQLLSPDLKKISVVVPNYNYAKYLTERLSSICEQNYPLYELIVLDDCSPDNSLEIIREFLHRNRREAIVISNAKNSGSVFRQWEYGVSQASGDLVWIAEADDVCTPDFVKDLAARFTASTALAFCDSVAVDSHGAQLSESYSFYYQDLPSNPMENDFVMSGTEFVRSVLSVKNVIMNVSGVIFNRGALMTMFGEDRESIRSYKVAGDWHLYVRMLSKSNSEVVYSARPNNVHRRHAISVTHALNHQRHIDEIKRVQLFARSVTQLPKGISRAAKEYLKDVTAQLTGARPN